ncbi:MAG: lipoyl(octanoyl) transferase LipB [Clostridia bacterium]
MKKVNIVDLGLMGYGEALEIQRKLRDRRIENTIGDTLLLVEHKPVLTMGRRGSNENVVATDLMLRENGIDIHWVERGGDVTYHGPGQLVVYPIFNLTGYGRDIHRFVDNLQNAIIRVLDEGFGIKAKKEDGTHTGVYVDDNKIAAIGLAIRKWVSMHGFAFNINTDLSHFRWIVPCGLSDRGVTSIKELTGREADFGHVKNMVVAAMEDIYGFEPIYIKIESLVE